MAKVVLRFLPGVSVFLAGIALEIGGYQSRNLANALWVLAVALLLIAALPWIRRIRFVISPEQAPVIEPAPPQERVVLPFATPDLTGNPLRGLSFRIAELAREDDIIRNRVFEDCYIYGPAVLAILNHVNMISPHIDGTLDSVIWDLNQQRVIGAIGLENCTFTDCKFRRIGFTGSKETMDQMRRSAVSGPAPNPPE